MNAAGVLSLKAGAGLPVCRVARGDTVSVTVHRIVNAKCLSGLYAIKALPARLAAVSFMSFGGKA